MLDLVTPLAQQLKIIYGVVVMVVIAMMNSPPMVRGLA
jgi:hypothetical protein